MMKTICVCGAGTMGSGIAFTAAQHGFTTIQYDVNTAMLDKSKAVFQKNNAHLVGRKKIDQEQADKLLARASFTTSLQDCKADIIIEAIIEDVPAKTTLLNQLAAINDASTIYASNTSSLSISLLQKSFSQPEQLAGLHFFNPAPVMKLVEIVKGRHTSNDVITQIEQLCADLGKQPVHCNDHPGFIVNRVARPFYLEALKLLEDGVASAESIDSIMEATGFKMGPFKLMDLIGMDINLSVSEQLYEALGKPARLKPSPLQEEKVKQGKLGKKTGEGFYKY